MTKLDKEIQQELYEVILTDKENEYDVSMRVELLKDLPRKATVKPQGEIISYFNVITSSKRLKETVIRFNLTQTAKLFGWNGSSWVDMVGYTENSCMLCYTYSILNYSSFAIVKDTSTAQDVSQVQPLVNNWSVLTPAPTTNNTPKQSSGFELIFVIAMIMVVRCIHKKY